MAYFLIDKHTNETIIAVDTIKVAELLKVHRHTINNRFAKSSIKNRIETEQYLIYKADKYYAPNTSKGNRDSKHTRAKKAEGEIELKYPKKR